MYICPDDYEYSDSEYDILESEEYNVNNPIRHTHREELVFVSKSQTNPIQSKTAPWINVKHQKVSLQLEKNSEKSERFKLNRIDKKKVEKININSLSIPKIVKNMENKKTQSDTTFSYSLPKEDYESIKNQFLSFQEEEQNQNVSQEDDEEEEEEIIIEYNSIKKTDTIQDLEIIRQKQIEDDIKEKEKKEKRLRKNAMRIMKKELEKQELEKKIKSQGLEKSIPKQQHKKIINNSISKIVNHPIPIIPKNYVSNTTQLSSFTDNTITQIPQDTNISIPKLSKDTDATQDNDTNLKTIIDNEMVENVFSYGKGIKKLTLKNISLSPSKPFLCYSYFNTNKCSNTNCIYAHNINEFLPKKCNYGMKCKKLQYCNFLHPSETKQDLINKITSSKKKYTIRLLN